MATRAHRKRQRLEIVESESSATPTEYATRSRRRRRRVAATEIGDEDENINSRSLNSSTQAQDLAEGLTSIPNSASESTRPEAEQRTTSRRRTRSSSRQGLETAEETERSQAGHPSSRTAVNGPRGSRRRRRLATGRFPTLPPPRQHARPIQQSTLEDAVRIRGSHNPLESHPHHTSWMSSSSEVSCIVDEDDATERTAREEHTDLRHSTRVLRSRGNAAVDDGEEVSEENHPASNGPPPPQPSAHRSSIMDKIRKRLEKPMSLADGLDEFDDTTEVDECPICMENFDEKEHAKSQPLECRHMFCISCLLKWSGMTSTCPLCKGAYTAIKKFDCDTTEPVIIPVSMIEGDKSDDWSSMGSDDELVGEDVSSDGSSSSSLLDGEGGDTYMCVICEEEGADTLYPSCSVAHRMHSGCFRGVQSCPGCLMQLRAPTFVTLGERLASVVMSNMRRRGEVTRRRRMGTAASRAAAVAAATSRAETGRRRRRMYSIYYDV